jgi:ABC-type xylose transport system permease subunit
MFVVLLVASFVLALALSITVAWLFAKPIDGILHRFVGDELSTTLAKYFKFAVVLVGISAGTRVRPLEEYIAAPSYNKAALAAAVTQEFWALELYRTFVETLQGIAWMFFVVAVIALISLFIIRKTGRGDLQIVGKDGEAHEPKRRVTTLR